ncbi:MAG TPA: LysM peptidoglycan-binding domain-containing protein [Firmicutes bacterium]|jgi:N-acetylmuramoyl-L-alanine amidase|nr:LysM peptidoglycan-binding domain-containing protein [Bacillota bacterium]
MKAKKPFIRHVSLFFALLVLLLPVMVSAQTYQVRSGDSLYLISRRFNIPTSTLKNSNNLGSNLIYPGQVLMIPTAYTVRPGDSLYLIATRNGVSLSSIRATNNRWHDSLMVGETLYLPSAQPQQPGQGGSGGDNQVYTVRTNDSLYLIAKRHGVTIQALKTTNRLSSDFIYPGQQLLIPVGTGSTPAPGGNGGNSGNQGGNYNQKYNLSAADIELLARLVRAEAEGESYEGQVAVAASVLNRLNDPRYPNTIREIVYQVDQGKYYQYSPVLDGRINLSATASTRKAVQDALNGWDPSYGAIGFYNPAKTSNRWVKSHPVTTQIGSHVFYKN